MFDEESNKIDKNGRSRMIMIVSGLAVVVVLALILIVTSIGSKKPDTEMIQMARPGSSEFDSYAPFIKITIGPEDKTTAKNLLNYIGMLRAEVENSGDQTLTGLQLRAVALGFDQEPLRELVISPVPRKQKTLGPHESISVEVQLDRIPDPDTIMDMTIELYGLRLN